MSHAVTFTLKSANAKVGRIPVSTTSNDTCPDACPLKRQGCYADNGPLGGLWRALSSTTAGNTFKNGRGNVPTLTWSAFCDAVAALPKGTLWRHNQAGDLPGHGDRIDPIAMAELIVSNYDKRGFTYTHKPITGAHGESNARLIKDANDNDFTVSLSANNLSEADTLAKADIGPVVVVIQSSVQGNVKLHTPEGRRVVVCPATYRDDTACADCGLCAIRDRKVIVGFPAHGATKRKADAVAMA